MTSTVRNVMLGTAAVLMFLLSLTSVSCVPAGHVGVVTTFGRVGDAVLPEGMNWVAPWRSVRKLSIRTQEDKETASCPTKEGLTVKLEVSMLYSLSRDKAAEVYQSVGADYESVLVVPQFRSALRSATTHYEAKDLYTANREQIESGLLKNVTELLSHRGIVCEAVYLRDLTLPNMVRDRIEAKLAADQDAQRQEFILKRVTQEAEQKRVEAKGIADAQQIIKKDLTHEYLVYLWIEALRDQAKNKNATTIYIPTGGDGMPLFKAVK